MQEFSGVFALLNKISKIKDADFSLFFLFFTILYF